MSAILVEIGSIADLGRRSLNRREWTRNVIQDKKLVKHKHHDAAEEGDTANIRQNTTNKGFFQGRRLGGLNRPSRWSARRLSTVALGCVIGPLYSKFAVAYNTALIKNDVVQCIPQRGESP